MDGRKGCFLEEKSEPGKPGNCGGCANGPTEAKSRPMVRSVADLLEIFNRDHK